jgi:hypothetical protein
LVSAKPIEEPVGKCQKAMLHRLHLSSRSQTAVWRRAKGASLSRKETNHSIREIVNTAYNLYPLALSETGKQGLRNFEPFHVKRDIFPDRGR